jgi:hypothetical protein
MLRKVLGMVIRFVLLLPTVNHRELAMVSITGKSLQMDW